MTKFRLGNTTLSYIDPASRWRSEFELLDIPWYNHKLRRRKKFVEISKEPILPTKKYRIRMGKNYDGVS